jgi:hypothetical protein
VKPFRFLLIVAGLFATVAGAHAQISVDLNIKRRSFIRYEPIIATVTVTNLSGRDLMLRDGEAQWFGFQIVDAGNLPVAPRNPNYHLDSLALKAGTTVRRTVNLNTLFGLNEFGIYRIRAQIFSDEMNKFFSSRPTNIEISEAHVMWQQTVGVPEGKEDAGSMRTVSLLVWQGPEHQHLYCRIENRDAGIVYCTTELGHLMANSQPEVQFDLENNFYILNFAGPKMYTLYKLGLNGEFLGETHYAAPKSRPRFRRLADGTLQIVGGQRQVAQATAAQPPQPKLSDRPPELRAKN